MHCIFWHLIPKSLSINDKLFRYLFKSEVNSLTISKNSVLSYAKDNAFNKFANAPFEYATLSSLDNFFQKISGFHNPP